MRLCYKLSRLSVETSRHYFDRVSEHVVEVIKDVLPTAIGIVLDGWTSNGPHHVGIFAVINDPGMPSSATRVVWFCSHFVQ